MFFLEIGTSVDHGANRRGEIITHGEWCFLFEMVSWSISNDTGKLLDCNDDASEIDAFFEKLAPGSVVAARLDGTSGRLTLQFSEGTELNVAPNNINPTDSEWTLFIPGELAWSWNPGSLTLDNTQASETRT